MTEYLCKTKIMAWDQVTYEFRHNFRKVQSKETLPILKRDTVYNFKAGLHPYETSISSRKYQSIGFTPYVGSKQFPAISKISILMGHCNHSLSIDVTIMVSNTCPIINSNSMTR